jgi:hypothetical protein
MRLEKTLLLAAVALALAVTLTGATACGGASLPEAAKPAVTRPAAPAPPPDLSAVPTPAGLIVYVRVTKPGAMAKTAMGWMHLSPPGARELGQGLAGEDIGEVVDIDQPLDFALLNGGTGMTPAWAAAVGVGSLEAVRGALPSGLTLAQGKDGAFWIRPTPHGPGEALGTTEHPCEFVPSAGSTPLRLVCGANSEALEYLAPYLARSSPRKSWDTDIHAELYTQPLKPFARLMRSQGPQLLESLLELHATQGEAVANLVEAGLGDVVDLIVDLEGSTLDVKLDPEGAKATLEEKFASRTSVLARLATAYPERSGPVPASFWRLPDDCDTAAFTRGYDPKDLEHARDLLVLAFEGLLGNEGLAPADQKAIGSSFDRILSDSPFVFGRGSDVVAMQKTLVAFQGAKEGAAKEDAARAALEPYLGWWVMGFDEPPERILGVWKALVLASNRPGTSAWLKKHVGSVPPPTLRLAPVPAGLPKGAMHVELAFFIRPDEPAHASPPKTGRPIKLHALVVPDATPEPRTWMVFASDEKEALSRAKALLASASPSPGASPKAAATLATRLGLDPLRAGHENGGGFSTLRAWVALSPEPTAASPGKGSDPLALLASLPAQGQSPIVFSSSATAAAPAGSGSAGSGAYSLSATLPRAAIEDIVLFAVKEAASGPSSVRGGGIPPGASGP